ncbi:MAG: L,D-transpeptidase [Bacteroidales bacterium]|nr:L,D-transpeptidase [Bacteroidales bacterium]
MKKDRPSAGRTFLKVFLAFIMAIGLSILLSWPVVRNFNKIQEIALHFKPKAELQSTATRIGLGNLKTYQESLDKDLAGIQKKLSVFLPKGPFLIINTSANNFRLMNEAKVLREGVCSTGSYTILQAGDNKQWIFKTPRGMFKILNKVNDPVWKKPDWAFIEEGLPVPSANHPSRYEYGVLGDHSMILGDGYMIHGTLYKRFLGMPVTHGCVRMGDADLEEVFKTMQIGSKVYIY